MIYLFFKWFIIYIEIIILYFNFNLDFIKKNKRFLLLRYFLNISMWILVNFFEIVILKRKIKYFLFGFNLFELEYWLINMEEF